MNQLSIVTPAAPYPNLAKPGTEQIPFWRRALWSLGLLMATSMAVMCGGVFGMLMLAFSMDSATANQIPWWLEGYVLVGWPVTLLMIWLVAPIMLLAGANWKWVFGTLGSLILFSLVYLFVAFVFVVIASM